MQSFIRKTAFPQACPRGIGILDVVKTGTLAVPAIVVEHGLAKVGVVSNSGRRSTFLA